MYCDQLSLKAEKFIHRIDKVLDDAIWHLTGAKKCRAANSIGKWAPPADLYRKKRQADYNVDYSYGEFCENFSIIRKLHGTALTYSY